MKPYLYLAALVGLGLFPGPAAAHKISYAEAYAQLQAGRPMVVVFSATWCPPCQRLKAALDGSDIPFAVWDVDHPPVAGQVFSEREGMPFVSIWHRGALIARMACPTVDQVASVVSAAKLAAPAAPPAKQPGSANVATPASPAAAKALGTAPAAVAELKSEPSRLHWRRRR